MRIRKKRNNRVNSLNKLYYYYRINLANISVFLRNSDIIRIYYPNTNYYMNWNGYYRYDNTTDIKIIKKHLLHCVRFITK